MPSGMLPLTGVALIALLAAGCQNQPGVAANPFASADRVPAPATRIPAPATSQPYYQGAGVATPHAAVAAALPDRVAAPTADAPQQIAAASLPAGQEAAIALPTDNQPLRPIAAATTTAPAVGAPVNPRPPATFAAAPQEPPLESPEFSPLAPPQPLAWGAAPLAAAAPSTPLTQAGYHAAAPHQPAQYQSAPRIRLPGYATPVSYQAPAAPASGPVGSVQTTVLPPTTAQTAPLANTIAGDGFQPRGAAPRRTPTPDAPRVF